MMLFVFSGFSFTATAWVKEEEKEETKDKNSDNTEAEQAQQKKKEKRVEQTYTRRFVDLFPHARRQIPPGAALHPYVAINSLMARSFR